MGLVEHPKMLLEAYLSDRAIELEVGRHEMKYEFIVDKNATLIGNDAIYLTGVVLIAGDIASGKLRQISDPKGPMLAHVSAITVRAKKKEEVPNAKVFEVPLYRQAFGNWVDESYRDTEIRNGDSANFVWKIPMPTDLEEDVLRRYGATLYCRLPDQLC
jgi:hypothetical protein